MIAQALGFCSSALTTRTAACALSANRATKTLYLGLGVADKACADLKIPGFRGRTEQRSQQCEQQREARYEAHQSLLSSTFNCLPTVVGRGRAEVHCA